MQNRHKHFIQKRLEFFVGRSRLSMFGVLITEPPTPPGIITSHIHHNIGFVLRHTSAENEELCGRATATVPSSRPACNDDICGDDSGGITKSSDGMGGGGNCCSGIPTPRSALGSGALTPRSALGSGAPTRCRVYNLTKDIMSRCARHKDFVPLDIQNLKIPSEG
jgi:hypothetical protein